jgi:hypothetical protein
MCMPVSQGVIAPLLDFIRMLKPSLITIGRNCNSQCSVNTGLFSQTLLRFMIRLLYAARSSLLMYFFMMRMLESRFW